MKNKIKILIIGFIVTGLSIILVQSCTKDEKKEVFITTPILTTSNVQKITESTAESGGSISNNGGSEVIAEGICWSISPNPSILDHTSTTDVIKESFTCGIKDLTFKTIYYVRAYATNTAGTSYGQEVTFTTADADLSPIKDIDNNIYHVVRIGTQTWTKENLRTTRFNDGTDIPKITDGEDWESATTAAYCIYNNTIVADSILTFGLLYNWYAATDDKLAPVGWHLPTEDDWNTLITYLGGNQSAGAKLKETGTSHWLYPNKGATNETGFTALPSGGRYAHISQYLFMTQVGGFWSSTPYPYDNLAAYTYFLYSHDARMDRGNYGKQTGWSIRFIKD